MSPARPPRQAPRQTPGQTRAPGTGAGGLASLRRLTAPVPEPAAAAAPGEAPTEAAQPCEMCGVAMDDRHGHVADTHDHRLLCVCRPCHLLFDRSGAGGLRYRGVGTDVRIVVDPALDPGAWDGLQIPVDLVFVLQQTPTPSETRGEGDGSADAGAGSGSGRQAFYPGPGGATESLLDLAWWERLIEANPVLGTVEADVEAVLLRRDGDEVACLVVPVDRCYELVGVVRSHWVGLAGGREVWERIDAFFDQLAASGLAVDRAGEPAVVPRAAPRSAREA